MDAEDSRSFFVSSIVSLTLRWNECRCWKSRRRWKTQRHGGDPISNQSSSQGRSPEAVEDREEKSIFLLGDIFKHMELLLRKQFLDTTRRPVRSRSCHQHTFSHCVLAHVFLGAGNFCDSFRAMSIFLACGRKPFLNAVTFVISSQ